MTLNNLYEKALFIRRFEEALLTLFKEGLVSGTVHTCVGQEGPAVCLHQFLNNSIDAFFATHRGHGHYIANGNPPEALLAEMMGRKGAVCEGRGGSQHLHYKNFFSNGIQGASLPQAVGYALALKKQKANGISVVQLGDGTLGQGAVYEAFNFAGLLQVPVLFFVELNGWAQSTDVTTTISGDLQGRANAFGLDTEIVSDDDWSEMLVKFEHIISKVRKGKPFVLFVKTRRLLAHSKGDDDRPADYIKELFLNDPLNKWLNDDESSFKAQARVKKEISELVKKVKSLNKISFRRASSLAPLSKNIKADDVIIKDNKKQFVIQLNSALQFSLGEDEKVFLIGEDIADPYGGAFKVTKGISSSYPSQVFSSPIAENSIVGVAVGASLAGFKPVIEIMFADFLTLAIDQLINSAAKMYYMYGSKVNLNLTVRLVSGGGRGYGPTHSQSLEKLVCTEPGIRVIALSHRHDGEKLLHSAIFDDIGPTVFIENKSLYASLGIHKAPIMLEFLSGRESNIYYPPLIFHNDDEAVLTIVSYGQSSEIVEIALNELFFEEEIICNFVILTQISPLNIDDVVPFIEKTRNCLVVDPNFHDYSFGATVASKIFSSVPGVILDIIGAEPTPIPADKELESATLPNVMKIKSAVLECLKKV